MDYIASGAGTGAVNGTYPENGTLNGKVRQTHTGAVYNIGWSAIEGWWAFYTLTPDNALYFNTDTSSTPPLTGWQVGDGVAPAPTLAADTGPVITDFTPESGTDGDVIVITGTGFTGATAVGFYFTQFSDWDFTVDSDTQITATVQPAIGEPAGPIYYASIRVTTAGGTDTTVPTPYFAYTPGAVHKAKGFFALL